MIFWVAFLIMCAVFRLKPSWVLSLFLCGFGQELASLPGAEHDGGAVVKRARELGCDDSADAECHQKRVEADREAVALVHAAHEDGADFP